MPTRIKAWYSAKVNRRNPARVATRGRAGTGMVGVLLAGCGGAVAVTDIGHPLR
jgi:hypothetical protein